MSSLISVSKPESSNILLDTSLSMMMLSLVDYYMKSVSATSVSLFVVSLVMAMLSMNDVTENKSD